MKEKKVPPKCKHSKMSTVPRPFRQRSDRSEGLAPGRVPAQPRRARATAVPPTPQRTGAPGTAAVVPVLGPRRGGSAPRGAAAWGQGGRHSQEPKGRQRAGGRGDALGGPRAGRRWSVRVARPARTGRAGGRWTRPPPTPSGAGDLAGQALGLPGSRGKRRSARGAPQPRRPPPRRGRSHAPRALAAGHPARPRVLLPAPRLPATPGRTPAPTARG